MEVTQTTVRNVLTRTTGFLRTVTSHSLQPYRGCSYGGALCGVGCYAQHNRWLTNGRVWGRFLDVRTNAAAAYREHVAAERRWARRRCDAFGVFMSSSTDPFVPQERRFGITASVLEAMLDESPDVLVVQTHSHRVVEAADRLVSLSRKCGVRVHLSIESDRDRLPGLPAPASSVDARFEAASDLKARGITVVVTVAPLLPIADPERFFRRVADCADGIVFDHFIEGDGSRDGARTRATRLPLAIEAVDPAALDLRYRDRMVAMASRIMPGRVGVSIDGFAGRYLAATPGQDVA